MFMSSENLLGARGWSVVGIPINYLYDGDNSIEEVDNNGDILARYAQGAGIDESLSMLRGPTMDHYQADGLGSITSLTSSSATIAAIYTYDAFGNLSSSTGSITNPFRYTAREFDPETNLNYYRARYYDTSVGRFISEDSSMSEIGVQAYRYAANEPTNYIDWDGFSPKLPYPTFPKGTPKGFVRKFHDGWDEMLSALNRKDCMKFFCDHGATPEKVMDTLSNTGYLFEPMPEQFGAATNGPDSVFINSKGTFVTGTDGYITLGNQRFNLHDPSSVAAMILLHELGHQLEFWGADRDSPDNAAHSIEILKHCFTADSFPVH